MRAVILFALGGVLAAQTPAPAADPAYAPLARAYEALRTREYDAAIAGFVEALREAPDRAAIHKDLAYTYLKVGENVRAREEFHRAMQIEPADVQVTLEYAFLCYETKQQAEARRIFDRVRKSGNPTAEQAFQNIDGPLAEGIERWQKAIAVGADNFSAHFELATLAEERDEMALAAEHYEKAWRLLPDRRSVLVDLGRALKAGGNAERANAALLAASRAGETRAAEMARELLPDRYPYVPEFRRALELDPANVELRRELGFLLLQMGQPAAAEVEFRALAGAPANDLLASAQLGFLLYARGDRSAAAPLLKRVLDSDDEDLVNRVRELVHLPPKVKGTGVAAVEGVNEAKNMAERSLAAGYIKDALRYFQQAAEADPADYEVMLKLGWTNNILHRDAEAYVWFDRARLSPDPKIAREAAHARENLRGAMERFRTTAWFYPLFSTRWDDQFGYAQVKTEVRTPWIVKPYVSLRFVGDTRQTIGSVLAGVTPEYLSESSFVVGAGLRTSTWKGLTGWFEAGQSIHYLNGHAMPDLRGGVSATWSLGRTLVAESSGGFADTALDAIFVSRFGNDSLLYSQSRAGYTFGPKELRAQVYWNGNVTVDAKRQDWANFVETGPGIRLSGSVMPRGMWVTMNILHGAYLLTAGNARGPAFDDLRAGVWYAFTR